MLHKDSECAYRLYCEATLPGNISARFQTLKEVRRVYAKLINENVPESNIRYPKKFSTLDDFLANFDRGLKNMELISKAIYLYSMAEESKNQNAQLINYIDALEKFTKIGDIYGESFGGCGIKNFPTVKHMIDYLAQQVEKAQSKIESRSHQVKTNSLQSGDTKAQASEAYSTSDIDRQQKIPAWYLTSDTLRWRGPSQQRHEKNKKD